jgi:hypothetical protein
MRASRFQMLPCSVTTESKAKERTKSPYCYQNLIPCPFPALLMQNSLTKPWEVPLAANPKNNRINLLRIPLNHLLIQLLRRSRLGRAFPKHTNLANRRIHIIDPIHRTRSFMRCNDSSRLQGGDFSRTAIHALRLPSSTASASYWCSSL